MIKKLPEIQIHSCAKINEKLNEVIDWINDVSALRVTDKQVTANLPNIDAGELAFLSKENSDLKDELERTRKENEDKQAVLNCVVDMLKVLNQRYALIMGKDVIKETVRLLEQKEHFADASKKIEQKDVK